MKIIMVCRFYLFLFLLFISGNIYAEGFYFGGGLSLIRLSNDHPSINNQNGTGYYLFAGTRSENWGFELAATGGLSFDTGQTPGIYYPEDSAEYGILDIGFKRYFHPKSDTNLSPWIGVGLGLHFVTWDTYYYNVDGFGYSVTGGVDYQIAPDWFIRGGMIYHDFKSDDTYEYGPYDGTASQVNLSIIYEF
jgi:outer membrane protein W